MSGKEPRLLTHHEVAAAPIWQQSRRHVEVRPITVPPTQTTSCQTDIVRNTLTDQQILELNTYDFLAHIGKNVINPGGTRGRDQILQLLDPAPGTRILEIGCGTGETACHIAENYRAHVTAVDVSSTMIRDAQRRVDNLGLGNQVECRVADITQLPFADRSFDYVICQAVLMFVDKRRAIDEIKRVLQIGGRFGGLEFSWKKSPPDTVRDSTYRICGCRTLEFYTPSDWGAHLQGAGLNEMECFEQPFTMLSPLGFVRDEGVANSVRIVRKLLERKSRLARMREIWQHFASHKDYFSYVVLHGRNGHLV